MAAQNADLRPLDAVLRDWAEGDTAREAVAATIASLATAGRDIAGLVARGAIEGRLGAIRRASDTGDDQKELDVRANDMIVAALREAPVAVFGSEEMDSVETLTAGAPLAVAVDPLDGSSNIETNVSIGTIFSVLPDVPGGDALLQRGTSQLAGGYVLYGPQTAMVLTVGDGVDVFTLDEDSGAFLRTAHRVLVPARTSEFAINFSNYRHWDPAIRQYVDDCLAGTEGPRARNFNARWIASMVAEAHRILTRGGVYLYPADARRGYERGRLRLVYEANPIGFVMEQAGAAATDGAERILDLEPATLHQRVPLVFGSAEEVEHVARRNREPAAVGERSPLFTHRGLLRA
jgi:fructose-1,6-bisphosphatase I